MDDQIKVEQGEILPISCNLCPKQFYEENMHKQHLKHTHMDAKQYTCNECGKVLIGSVNFSNHRWAHKKRFWRCEHKGCFYTTDRKDSMKTHLRSHRLLFCDVVGCEQEFYGKKNLYIHKMKLHKKPLSPKIFPKKERREPKMHQCGSCSYTTRFTSHLRAHVLTCNPPIVLVF